MFTPEPPRDLVLPAPGSKTGRAIASLARRALFERWKTLHTPAEGDRAARDAYTKLREVLVGFLPGHPHAIAGLVGRPTVGTPLRRLRDGRGDRDTALREIAAAGLFALACEGQLASEVAIDVTVPELVHLPTRRLLVVPPSASGLRFDTHVHVRDAEPTPRGLAAVEGALVLRSRDEGVLPVLREGLDLLRRIAPALRDDLSLFVHEIVVGDHVAHALPAEHVGTALVPVPATGLDAALDLASNLVAQKLRALAELDPLVDDAAALDSVIAAAAASLRASLAATMVARGDARSCELDRARVSAAAHEAFAQVVGRPTQVGSGVLDELARLDRALTEEKRT